MYTFMYVYYFVYVNIYVCTHLCMYTFMFIYIYFVRSKFDAMTKLVIRELIGHTTGHRQSLLLGS